MRFLRPAILGSLFIFATTIVLSDSHESGEADNPVADPNLVPVKGAFKETWVNPDKDVSQFSAIYLWEANFEYRDVGPAQRTRSTMMNTRNREFGIADADREKFEEVVSEAFVKELSKIKNWQITEEIGPGTLLLRGSVLDIVSLVPPEHIGRSEVYLATVGEATLVLELIDASDGEHVAIAAERRAIQPIGGGQIDTFSMPTNNVTIISDVRRWASRHASTLRKAMEKAAKDR